MEVRVTSEVAVVIIVVVTIAIMLIGYFLIGPPGNRRWNKNKWEKIITGPFSSTKVTVDGKPAQKTWKCVASPKGWNLAKLTGNLFRCKYRKKAARAKVEATKLEEMREGGLVDWNSARAKLIVAGPILIVLGLVLYVARGEIAVLVFPVIGVILLIARVIWELSRGRKKPENLTSGTS